MRLLVPIIIDITPSSSIISDRKYYAKGFRQIVGGKTATWSNRRGRHRPSSSSSLSKICILLHTPPTPIHQKLLIQRRFNGVEAFYAPIHFIGQISPLGSQFQSSLGQCFLDTRPSYLGGGIRSKSVLSGIAELATFYECGRLGWRKD